MATNFKDNVTVITGASMGLGRELANQLADQGAWLVLAARSQGLLQEVVAECKQRGGRSIAVPTDVSVEPECRRLIENAVAVYGRIDTLVNNAGIGMTARFDTVQDISHYDRIMRTNYLGSVFATHYALPYLKKTHGRLVAISSLAGKTGVPLYSAYCASKHAMVGFFESVRIEIQSTGVSVTIIMPDFVATGIHERNVDAQGKLLGQTHGIDYNRAMDIETCVRKIVQAMAKRDRQLLMSPRGKVGQWIKLIAPQTIDRLAARAMDEGG